MEKAINNYSVKGHNLEIKDLDEGSRTVQMYLAKFDTVDSDNDIIRRGAFSRSIGERGPASASNRKIAFLRYHNWENQIGKFLELSEDNVGLLATGQLGNSTKGNDALQDYKDGIILEHSIGFKYIKDGIRFIEVEGMDRGGYYDVTQVALWEGSAVTFGANEFTNVVEVAKSENKIDSINKLGAEIDTVTKALISGGGSDDRLYQLEMKLKFLNAQLLTIAKADPFVKHSAPLDPSRGHSEIGNIKGAFDWAKLAKGVK